MEKGKAKRIGESKKRKNRLIFYVIHTKLTT